MAATIRFLRPKQVCERTGLRYRQLAYLEDRGQFPPRRRLTTRLVGWVESEIDDWLNSRPLGAEAPTDIATNRKPRRTKKRSRS